MAISYTSGGGASNVAPPTLATSPDKYVSLGDLLDPTKPDNRDLLVNTYGDQGITGFLTLTGAVTNAGTADEVQWWEEGRLHKTVSISAGGIDITSGATGHFDVTDADAPGCRLNDVLLTPGGQRLVAGHYPGHTVPAPLLPDRRSACGVAAAVCRDRCGHGPARLAGGGRANSLGVVAGGFDRFLGDLCVDSGSQRVAPADASGAGDSGDELAVLDADHCSAAGVADVPSGADGAVAGGDCRNVLGRGAGVRAANHVC